MRKEVLIVLGLLAACKSSPESRQRADHSALFQKVLISGASISANYNKVPSPGQKLAEKYNATEMIERIARNGARSAEIISQIESKDLNLYSSVVAVDLFFWDSAEAGCDAAVENVKKITSLVSRSATKLMLGNIPRLEKLPLQPCMNTLNASLEENCTPEKSCRLIPLRTFYEGLNDKGSILYQNREWTKFEMLPDGLHLSPKGSDCVADKILEMLN